MAQPNRIIGISGATGIVYPIAETEAGGIVFPLVPAFYQRPATLEDVVGQTVDRVLDLFELEAGLLDRCGVAPQPFDRSLSRRPQTQARPLIRSKRHG